MRLKQTARRRHGTRLRWAAGIVLLVGLWSHAQAADRLASRIGPVGYLAGDLADELPFILAS